MPLKDDHIPLGGPIRCRSDRAPPVDAFEQHRQLRRCQRHAPVRDLRPDELAVLEPLGEQAQAVAVPSQHLDSVSASAPEHEDLAAEGIGLELDLNEGRQPVEAAPHVGDAGRDPDPRPRRRGDHRNSTASTCASTWASGRPSTVSCAPLRSIVSRPNAAAGTSSISGVSSLSVSPRMIGTNAAAPSDLPDRPCATRKFGWC